MAERNRRSRFEISDVRSERDPWGHYRYVSLLIVVSQASATKLGGLTSRSRYAQSLRRLFIRRRQTKSSMASPVWRGNQIRPLFHNRFQLCPWQLSTINQSPPRPMRPPAALGVPGFPHSNFGNGFHPQADLLSAPEAVDLPRHQDKLASGGRRRNGTGSDSNFNTKAIANIPTLAAKA